MLFLGFLMNDANYEKALSVCTDALKKHEDSHHGNQLKQMHEFLEKKNMD